MSEKTIYQEKIQARIEKLQARTEELQAKAKGVKADLKQQALEAIGDLRSKQTKAEEKLGEMRQAGEAGWSALRAGVEESVDDLASALEKASEQIDRAI